MSALCKESVCIAWHAQVRFENRPWRLCSAPLLSEAERRQLHIDFFEAPECCLDEWFSEWFRLTLSDPRDLDKPSNKELIAMLCKVPSTNMAIERHLAQVRQSASYSKMKPLAEKLVHVGCLSELRKLNLGFGFKDPLIDKRQDMLVCRLSSLVSCDRACKTHRGGLLDKLITQRLSGLIARW